MTNKYFRMYKRTSKELKNFQKYKEVRISKGQLRNKAIANHYVLFVNTYVPVVIFSIWKFEFLTCPVRSLGSLLILLDIQRYLFVIFPFFFTSPHKYLKFSVTEDH